MKNVTFKWHFTAILKERNKKLYLLNNITTTIWVYSSNICICGFFSICCFLSVYLKYLPRLYLMWYLCLLFYHIFPSSFFLDVVICVLWFDHCCCAKTILEKNVAQFWEHFGAVSWTGISFKPGLGLYYCFYKQYKKYYLCALWDNTFPNDVF